MSGQTSSLSSIPGAALLLLLVLRVRLHQDHHVRLGTSTSCSIICVAARAARRGRGWQRDLGHCDNLVGRRRIDILQYSHQLVHHLRLRNTETRHDESDVGKLLHGVSLYLLLRPPAALPGWQAASRRALLRTT